MSNSSSFRNFRGRIVSLTPLLNEWRRRSSSHYKNAKNRDKETKLIRSQWGYACYLNTYSSQSRGVRIFINNSFGFKFVSMEKDASGNLLILHCKIKNLDFSLFCIYGPNNDNPEFYTNITHKLSQMQYSCILGGGFNLVWNPE